MSLQIEFKYNYNYELMVYTKAYSYIESKIEMQNLLLLISLLWAYVFSSKAYFAYIMVIS